MLKRKSDFLLATYLFAFLALFTISVQGQHYNKITAELHGNTSTIDIIQEFKYYNSSNDTLSILYFNDWINSYSNKNTPLAKRFEEQFKKSLHLAKDEERGYTKIYSISDEQFKDVDWFHTSNDDILEFHLNKPIAPKESITLYFTYTSKLPSSRFTNIGYDSRGEFYLKDWYLTPAVYDGEWHLYSNKNLEDLYTGIANSDITFKYPKDLFLNSNFEKLKEEEVNSFKEAHLVADYRKSCDLILLKNPRFTKHQIGKNTIVTDINVSKFDEVSRSIAINKVSEYIFEHLGSYPHTEMLVSTLEYRRNPLYGINQLPSFVRPYKSDFQFELKYLKTALNSFFNETLFLDPRKERWVNDALVNFMMIAYVEEYYPDQKLLGNLSKIWGFRKYNLAKTKFVEQYPLVFMHTARKNNDQSLTTSNDSLVNFNQKIGNRYKAGAGLSYLANYVGEDVVYKSIKEFYAYYKLRPVTAMDFEMALEKNVDKDISWFFDEYVTTNDRIDFKIKKVEKTVDSLKVTLKNKSGTNVPISLFGIAKDSVVSKYWIANIDSSKTFTIPKNGEDKLVLNYDKSIPEFNQRDNWKSLGGFLSGNKKLKFQFFKDTEDPYYNQIFYMPSIRYNLYDGITPSIKINNSTFLDRPFNFSINPAYAMKEKTLVGGASFSYKKFHNKTGYYLSSFGLSGSTYHFQVDSRYAIITPFASFAWRPDYFRSNKRNYLNFRYINIFRSISEELTDIETTPDYRVFNARYGSYDKGIINYYSWLADFQYAGDFTKISFEIEYRKLFQNNMQFNTRFFAGKFLNDNTNTDFFSFALDRPTDYLFDYNYLGRSESSGIFSQQFVLADGGFKSKLDSPFANDFIVTTNNSMSVWRWIELYGDLGLIKNRNENARFVYDSGVRLNLVTDYLEFYLPLYSNNGWEVGQPNYAEKIRFVISLQPKTITRLFTRKWF
ncbi:metalloprotease [Cellulophaga baltica]|uniref:metalloprotease n=1 Tax=Cellulophaga TaxID=104264 RepID=UPI001C07B74A|nr:MULTISPECIES: metalloprotease [Cellulophaga]MBU2996396.1 metalloprotease [Cellulophaga baltica]MDO6767792.1 metalloprotease [Cellulophaga sp. 1_MG-2023]